RLCGDRRCARGPERADATDRRSRRSRDTDRGLARSRDAARVAGGRARAGRALRVPRELSAPELARRHGARGDRRLAPELQGWRFSWNVTGGAPVVTLISPSITAPSATAIEAPERLPVTRAVPAISTRSRATTSPSTVPATMMSFAFSVPFQRPPSA